MGDHHLLIHRGRIRRYFKPSFPPSHHQWALSAGAVLGNFFHSAMYFHHSLIQKHYAGNTSIWAKANWFGGLIKHVLQLVSSFLPFLFFFFWRQRCKLLSLFWLILAICHWLFLSIPSWFWRLADDSFLIVDLCSYGHMYALDTVWELWARSFPRDLRKSFCSFTNTQVSPYTFPLGRVEGLERSRYRWYHEQLL